MRLPPANSGEQGERKGGIAPQAKEPHLASQNAILAALGRASRKTSPPGCLQQRPNGLEAKLKEA